jgi:hypothetical protein
MRAPFSPVFFKHKARTPAAHTFLPLDACLTKFVKKEARKREKKHRYLSEDFHQAVSFYPTKKAGLPAMLPQQKTFFPAISCHAPAGYLEFINFNVSTKKRTFIYT